MHVKQIEINKLFISQLNVRKTLTSENDETNISDLASDIQENGLLNPLTVRFCKDTNNYEIMAGQRRFLAMTQLNYKEIPCHVIDVSDQNAEKISLIENVQRNQMTFRDKIIAYSKLYDIHDQNINKLVSILHISNQTLSKYIKLRNLPDHILTKLDIKGDQKVTFDVAIELSKLNCNNDTYTNILDSLKTFPNQQRLSILKQYNISNTNNLNNLTTLINSYLPSQNKTIPLKHKNNHSPPNLPNTTSPITNPISKLPNSQSLIPPYIIDKNNTVINIPENLYNDVIKLINKKEKIKHYLKIF